QGYEGAAEEFQGSEYECLFMENCPTLLEHEIFDDALKIQILELMGEILVELDYNKEEFQLEEAVGLIDRTAPITPTGLLDLQVYQLRRKEVARPSEHAAPPERDSRWNDIHQSSAILFWAADNPFCLKLFKSWNWLPEHDYNFSI